MSTREILDAALKLDPAERARLVEEIVASLDDAELGPEWEDEIRARLDDLDSGRVRAVPGPEAVERVRRRLHGG